MKKDQRTPILVFILLSVASVFIWSLIKPEGYLIWILEVLPAVVLWIIVLAVYKRFRFTTLSYIVMAALSIMMFIGAHYTYSQVPLFDWIKDYFNLNRNHYDRFGHFLKGLFAIVIRELLLRLSPLKKGAWTTFITLSIALAISALYEIIEWAASAVSKDGKTSKQFLGTQGDIWDTQWDMTLLLIGSILALLLLSKYHNKQLKKLD
ncbi:putative membrane protein [Bacillus ectoiniformans]|uniref:DUF2238 domain-containing protein n=1 Tax=Bacillus ectoiniformans TaxID=1494429 RepID=UPI001958E833|nr:DUF2238 domain-containing protein [Bacillus ectoiniformans]MBM7647451.1 putative membrane protein [Bacillus ectoiniformans]